MTISTIETLHSAWTRAGAIHENNDRLAAKARDEVSPATSDAMKVLDRQMIDMSLVILREMPATTAEALILAKHMSNAADLIAHSVPVANDEDMSALNIATENLLVFLVRRFGNEARQVDATFELARVAARTAVQGEA